MRSAPRFEKHEASMTDRLLIADASRMSGADFLRALQGKPPLTEADRIAKRAAEEAYWAEYRKQARAELEQLRDNLCALASPELAAKFRAKWAIEDSERHD
jgi:hypothetical protein